MRLNPAPVSVGFFFLKLITMDNRTVLEALTVLRGAFRKLWEEEWAHAGDGLGMCDAAIRIRSLGGLTYTQYIALDNYLQGNRPTRAKKLVSYWYWYTITDFNRGCKLRLSWMTRHINKLKQSPNL